MPTNQEWLHKLANESPDELKAWFDAEHNDTLAAEKVVSGYAAHSKDGNAHLKASEDLSDVFTDSREKLEEDVRQILHSAYMLAWMHGNENRRGCSFEKLHVEFYNLLDRQAAITERECRDCDCWDYCETCELQEQVDKLTAELEAEHALVVQFEYDNEHIKAERDNLAKDLNDMMRSMDKLCDRFRDASSSALDNAHEIQRIIDNFWTV